MVNGPHVASACLKDQARCTYAFACRPLHCGLVLNLITDTLSCNRSVFWPSLGLFARLAPRSGIIAICVHIPQPKSQGWLTSKYKEYNRA
jgi:hypothetical protein